MKVLDFVIIPATLAWGCKLVGEDYEHKRKTTVSPVWREDHDDDI